MSEGEDSAEARLRKKTIPLLRSVLVANAKSGVPLHLLCHEYQETCLEPLSFRNMGYGSLEQFLRDIPEVCSVVRSSEGFLVVKGIATKEDAHIYKLVSGQRNPKKKLSSKKPLSLKVTRNASFFKLAPPRSVSSSTEIQSKKTLYNSTFSLSHHLPPAQYNSNRLNFGSYFKQKNEGPQWSLIVREKQYNKNKDVIDLTKDDISKKNKTFTSKQGSWQSSKPVSSFNKSDFSSETNLYCSTSSIKETKDLTMEEISSLEKKIRDLLKLRPNGLWLTRLKPEFKTIYKEDLQCDIKSVIEKHFLHFVDIQSPAPNREILYLKQSTIDSSTDSDKLVISISNSATESNRSVLLRNDTSAILGLNSQNSNKSNDLTFLKQNPGNTQSSLLTSSNFKATWVEVPVKEEYLDVIVNCVVSTKYISVIMLGPEYNEKLEQLENEISELYQNSEPVTSTVCLEVGRFYAAYFDSSWYRVELLTVASNECQVLLVDHGKKETIAAAEIKDLPIKYLALPFQAISCSLYKVPESFDADILQYLSEITDGNALIAHIIERPNKNNKDFVIELYSSSNEAEESINQELISRIETENNLQPQLAEEGYQTQGYITHITPEGELFVQILGPGLERLEILMMDMASHFSQKNSGSEIIAHPEIGEVCCAKYPNDGAWYRAQVTQILTEEHKVEVEFVDYGNQTVLSHLHIRKPTAVSEKVVSLPFQAIKCQVYGLAEKHFDANAIEKMKYFVESYLDVVIIESVKVSKVNLPLVKIFVPDGENDLTSFVDWFLKMLPKEKILEVSITSPQQDDTTHNFIKSANLPVDSSKTKTFLNPKLSQQKRCFNNAVWKIPEIQLEKSIFEGFVQEVVHPHKFLIVPTSLWNDFQTMHMELLSFYKDKKDCEGTHFEVGDLCAVYSKEDELWHRAIIHANIEEKFVVNFPDSSFNIEVVSIENIQVLDSAFTKFPFFAIRCSLDGIEPISGDKKWSNEASSQFADKVYLETFQVEIVKSCLNTKIFHVLLHGASLDDKHFIVNDQLVLSGLARYKN